MVRAPLQEKSLVDVLDPLRDLSAYKVVFVPNFTLIHPGIADNIKRYVQRGGTLILGPKAALKDWNGVFFPDVRRAGVWQSVRTTVKPAPFRIDRDVMPAKRVTMLPDAPFAGRMSFCNEAPL